MDEDASEDAVAGVYRGRRLPLDPHDATIRDVRRRSLDEEPRVRCGDYVEFADGVVRRVSHVHRWEGEEELVQTSGGGSWYLGDGYASFSGSLYPSVGASTLTRTDERREGLVWFFHHDWHEAHNGVSVTVPFRVYRCSVVAPD